MDTRYMKTFCCVLRHGSFSKASVELCITQAAVSQRIKLIEDHFGVGLVERNGHGVRATNAGSVVSEYFTQILDLENRLQAKITDHDNSENITICCTPTFSAACLPEILNMFLPGFSGMGLRFTVGTPEFSLKAIVESSADIAVVEHCEDLGLSNDYSVVSLGPDLLTVVSSPSLGIPRQIGCPDLLFDHRLITRKEGCSSRCLLQKNLKQFNRTLNDFKGIIVYDDIHAIIRMVLEGKGIAFVSNQLVSEHIESGKLSGTTISNFVCSRSRSIITSKNKNNEHILEFISCSQKIFK